MVSGVGLLTSIVGNSVVLVGAGIANDLISGKKTTAMSIGINAAIGVISGAVGGKGARFGEITDVVDVNIKK